MATPRCHFCTARPREEVAVSRWLDDPDDRERLTLWICAKHLTRLRKAGPSGWEHGVYRHKIGFW